ncbi:thioredoxin-like protein [Nadsonia fulvescens var. elongata DSM 6958]|uniref:Thioredoxin-like protein n=1 Tax=Nadsonia fulvescens var. elongata DSM 6958 TaxID=857566 RepID=A0A1E3PNQ3_9ASCO|nr:thioredoxin-like protein [Nadsonia fulvescens var. elongata DSM 6958]
MNVEVNPNEDTEWNDILRAKGIIPEKPPSPSTQLEAMLEDAIQHQHDNRLEGLDLDELDALEDDEDEDFLQAYRLQRMQEIHALAAKPQFGSVVRITKPEYVKEITDASRGRPLITPAESDSKSTSVVQEYSRPGDSDVSAVEDGPWVFVHISYSGVTQSRLLNGLFEVLAGKYSEIKFVDIDARQINDKYAMDNCPTILIYHNGDVVNQIVTLATLGGSSTRLEDMEKLLTVTGALKANDRRLIENQDYDSDGNANQGSRKSIRNGSSHYNRNYRDLDDSNDDEDDFYD